MSLEGLTEDQIATRKKELLELVPATGTIGNTTLRSRLKWDASLYWAIRNRLIDEGKLEKGRGKGGSVRRIEIQPRVAQRHPESQLYAPILDTIKSAWVQDYRADLHYAEVTAHKGRKDTGGKWTRPDITLATYNSYLFVPGKHFDVTTFEVKKHDALDVTVVYEALAHHRAANYSYVLIHVPDELRDALDETLQELSNEAGRHGIGFVVLSDPHNYETWEVWEEAERHDPDPADLSDFLARMSAGFKAELTKWFQS
jgi:hypothetical protein